MQTFFSEQPDIAGVHVQDTHSVHVLSGDVRYGQREGLMSNGPALCFPLLCFPKLFHFFFSL